MYPERQPALYSDHVPASDYTPSPRTRRLLMQLDAEIAAHGMTMKSLALKMGKPYVTFRRYVRGERPMPADELLDALDALDVSYVDFMRRAAER